jgi:hypothetical protein
VSKMKRCDCCKPCPHDIANIRANIELSIQEAIATSESVMNYINMVRRKREPVVKKGGEEVSELQWKFSGHLAMDKQYIKTYRSEVDGKGVRVEIVTPVLRDYGGPKDFGKPEVYFFIDGDEREFRTEKDLIAAVGEKGDRIKAAIEKAEGVEA